MIDNVVSLRKHCLNFWEVLAQAVALISPTMTAALIVPLMFATTGNASWLAYAFATVMLLFVALNLNVFAKRSSTTGSMFLYVVSGLGRTAGGLTGWSLIWAYVFIGTAGLAGFTIFAQELLALIGLHPPAILTFAISALVSWYLAYRDITLSTILMLVVESVSVALILILAAFVLGHHGFAPDVDQLQLKGNTLSNLGLGVVVAIFSLVGFECATAFGEEAKEPLVTIPRAVLASLLLSGAFFIVIAYVEILGFRGATPSLDKVTTPLSSLAALVHMDLLRVPIDAGAMVSFFSLTLSCMNAAARVVFQMGRQGYFPESTGRAHATNATPHVAVTLIAIVQFVIPTVMTSFGVAVGDVFNDAGTFGAFGFLVSYIFVSLAAPAYLRKLGELRAPNIAISAAALVCLLVPAVGSVYPVPAPPVNAFPYLFGAYFAIGAVFFIARRKAPSGIRATVELAEEGAIAS